MIDVAITGSYCSGKTTVISILSEQGYRVFSCDDYVADLYHQKEVTDKIKQLIPKVQNSSGQFVKKKLLDAFLTESTSRNKIESIIHPLVRQQINQLKKSWLKTEKIGFFEVPLLFEKGLDKEFEKIVCCYCDEHTRYKRAMGRMQDESKAEIFYDLIGSLQLDQEEKKRKADFLIDTNDNIANIKSQLQQIIKSLISDE